MSQRYHVIREDCATGTFQDWHTVSAHDDDPDLAAIKTAEFHHAHCDGWEWQWPVSYIVVDERGKAWRIEVEREMVPEFIDGIAEEIVLPAGAMPPIDEVL